MPSTILHQFDAELQSVEDLIGTDICQHGFLLKHFLKETSQEFLSTYDKNAYLCTIAFLFISFPKLSYGQEKIFSPLGKNFSMPREKYFYAYRAKF